METGTVRNYIGFDSRFVNADLSTEELTVFERFSSHNTLAIQSPISRGAKDVWKLPTLNSEVILRRAAEYVAKKSRAVVVAWLPRGDTVSHTYGPQSKEFLEEMKVTSRGIGRLARILRESNVYESTGIVFTADHGQKAVSKRCRLDQILNGLGLESSINSNDQSGFRVRTNGDAAAFLYSDDNKISRDCYLDLLERLVHREGVELAFFRSNACTHYVLSRRGCARIELNSPNLVKYNVEYGGDPLFSSAQSNGRIFDLSVPAIDSHDIYGADVLYQYLTSHVEGRSANILLSSSPGFHFGVAPRMAWRFGFHRGSHGGLSREEMVFSAISTFTTSPGVDESLYRSKDLLSEVILN